MTSRSEALWNLLRLRVTQVRLMEVLVASHGPVSGREFARKLGISPTSAIAALKRLEKAGVVTREAVGKAHLWRLDDTEEAVREWRAEHAAARQARLLGLIKEHSGTRHQKVLHCAQDVWDEVRVASAPAAPRRPWEPDLRSLTAIEVTVAGHYEPGRWKMIRHDHCLVTGGDEPGQAMLVTHEECTVLGTSEDEP
jgi:predicted ArsR family transcriptional regulator